MQVPRRRAEQSIKRDTGPYLVTAAGLERLHKQLARLHASLPEMISEVERTKGHGDFSENAAYQDAKATLRRTHSRVESVKDRIKRAVLIEKDPKQAGIVQVGSIVTLKTNGKQVKFEILGSHESNPSAGRISNTSPLGQALLGHKAGDSVGLDIKSGRVEYNIISVE